MGSSCICSTKNPITTQNQLDPKLITLNSKTSKHFRTSIYISNRENIHKRYITKETIGQGFFSKVKLVESKTDPPKNYVVKTISKDTLSLKELHSLIREIQLLSQLDHPNIIKYYETYDDENEFHIIMNHCTGGELFDKLQNEGPLPEHECAAITYQILHAISHCHSRGIVHRDIKAENILFNDKAHNKINIIDFGLSKKTKNDNGNMHTFVGTTLYLSPEVISGKYDEKCDLWSIGVLLYFMLYGRYPFDDENGEKEKIFHKIKHEEPDYDIPESCVSRSAKSLIQKLLKKKPKHRYNAQEALNDPWFIKHITNNIHITALNLPKLQSRTQPTTFIKKIFGFIIKEIDSDQIENLRKQFYLLDDDKTGVINLKKYSSSLSKKSKGESLEDGSCAKQTNNGANTNSIPINHCGTFNETVSNSNELDYTSFVITSLKNKNLLTQTIFRNVFNRLDNDGKGVLNLNGINKAFRRIGKKLSNDILQKMIIESGFENADNITFDNFVKVINLYL